MKRTFILLVACVTAITLTSCGGNDYKEKAWNWMRSRVDHVLCADAERHALYFFEPSTAGYTTLLHVDLDDFKESAIYEFVGDGKYSYGRGLKGYILPEDRGYDSENATFVVAGYDADKPNNVCESALIYDTATKRVKKICENRRVIIVGDLITSCNIEGYYSSAALRNVDVYNAKGEKQVQRTFVGTIARQNVCVELAISDKGSIAGSYYYTKYGPTNRMLLYGDVDKDGEFVITGFNANETPTEEWVGTFKDGNFVAEFENLYNGRSYDFTLTEQK